MRPNPSHVFRAAAVVPLFVLLFIVASPGSVHSEDAPLRFNTAGWTVAFTPGSGRLECTSLDNKVALTGGLTFRVVNGGQREDWRFEASRDSISNRVALVDTKGNAQGYLAISLDSAHVRLHVLPRPPQQFLGELECKWDVVLGPEAFACRIGIPDAAPVVQMASGPADSALNESLFDPASDLAIRFAGRGVLVTTRASASTPSASSSAAGRGSSSFLATLTTTTLDNDGAMIELLPHYYRTRYVPDYHQIDRKRAPHAPTGWMSWNAYFDTAGEKENLDEARLGAKYLKPFGLEIWSIESWQDNSPRLPVSDFHNLTLRPSPAKFPHGMKWLAGQIRDLGFRPGIWTVPFGTGDSNYYAAHKEWFLHDAQGHPMQNWCGRYLIDPSQQAVRKQMEESHRTMSADWGYEFFKIDGMSGRDPGYSAHFFERCEVRAAFRETVDDPYRRCLEALRRGVGPDRIFLACQGHYTGPEAAVADAARLGSDIVTQFQPPHWENYFNQARLSQAQLFTHNIVWYNDPDTLMVAEPASMDTARLAATVVAMPGQLTFFGDKLGGLSPERMRLLQQTLPVCDAHPLDLAPNNILRPIWDLKVSRPFAQWDVVSVFNWEEKPGEQLVEFAQLGLRGDRDYLVFDFWNHAFLGSRRGRFSLPVPAHGNCLLAIHERADHPQFLSTDRHITQGAVEWLGSTWNAAAGELGLTLHLVENDPLTVYMHVPDTHLMDSIAATGAEVLQTTTNTSPAIAVVLRRPTSGDAHLTVKFQPKERK
jgi:hypothetical protein